MGRDWLVVAEWVLALTVVVMLLLAVAVMAWVVGWPWAPLPVALIVASWAPAAVSWWRSRTDSSDLAGH